MSWKNLAKSDVGGGEEKCEVFPQLERLVAAVAFHPGSPGLSNFLFLLNSSFCFYGVVFRCVAMTINVSSQKNTTCFKSDMSYSIKSQLDILDP